MSTKTPGQNDDDNVINTVNTQNENDSLITINKTTDESVIDVTFVNEMKCFITLLIPIVSILIYHISYIVILNIIFTVDIDIKNT